MDSRLQEMVDHHEIRQLLATYCHGCDRLDEVEMAGTYCVDSWDDHGPRKMPGRAFAIVTVKDFLENAGGLCQRDGPAWAEAINGTDEQGPFPPSDISIPRPK